MSDDTRTHGQPWRNASATIDMLRRELGAAVTGLAILRADAARREAEGVVLLALLRKIHGHTLHSDTDWWDQCHDAIEGRLAPLASAHAAEDARLRERAEGLEAVLDVIAETMREWRDGDLVAGDAAGRIDRVLRALLGERRPEGDG